jgi:hypothetical protein
MRSPHEEHLRNPSFTEPLLRSDDAEEYDLIEDANELGEDNNGEYRDDDSVKVEGMNHPEEGNQLPTENSSGMAERTQ